MALSRARLTAVALGLSACALAGLQEANAAGRRNYRFKDSSCPVKLSVKRNWQAAEAPWKVGEWVLGTQVSGKPDALYLFYKGKTYATPSRCWTLKSGGEVKPVSPQSLSLVYLNWQEDLPVVETASGDVFSMRVNQAAWGVAYSRVLKAWSTTQLSAMGLLYTASSLLKSPSTTVPTPNCPECAAFGVALAPEIDWRRTPESPAFGLSVPVVARLTNWASSDAYVIQKTQRLLYGPMLQIKLARPGWEFSSRLGFFNSLENLAWYLSVGRVL
jgi:hypothetical protein